MALQVTYTDPASRLVMAGAYAQIQYLHIDAVALTLDLAIAIYVSAAAKAAGGSPLLVYHAWPPFSAIMNGPVDIPVASYAYVKTLGIFSGATDVA